jgi:glycosyltransferase domain-containing protein
LDYYCRTNIKIIVSDSSDNSFLHVNDYPHITYLYCPRAFFLQKIYETLPFIQTPYVFYCADDDFIVPQAAEQIVSFLETHLDYCTAQGHYLTFEQNKKGIEFSPRYIRYFGKKIVSETGVGRLEQYENMYASNLYSVIRTETFKEMYTACRTENGQLRFNNLFLAEEYFNLFSLIQGNYVTIPVFYAAREFIPGSATNTTIPFSTVATTPEYYWEYSGFINTLTEKLVKKDGLSTEQAKKIILHTIQKPKVNINISFKRKILEYLGKYSYTRYLNHLLRKRYKQKGLKAVKGMASYPCNRFTPEIQDIIECINNRYR